MSERSRLAYVAVMGVGLFSWPWPAAAGCACADKLAACWAMSLLAGVKTTPQPSATKRIVRPLSVIAFKTPANLYSTGPGRAGQDSRGSWLPLGRASMPKVTCNTTVEAVRLLTGEVLRPPRLSAANGQMQSFLPLYFAVLARFPNRSCRRCGWGGW